ncbi:MAG: hypothetical protein LLG04_18445 [Parachlamydia sp.]|nr:hypothetical protein [Parachlamydia sp.]
MTWLSILAGTISSFAFLPYILSILRHETKPHLVTWWIWTFLGAVITASYYASGAPLNALIVPIVYILGPLVVALLCFKYGEYGANAFDLSCFAGGIAGILLWLLTGNPALALYLNLIVDFCGAMPTIRKVALNPRSENLTAWILFLLGNVLNLMSIPYDSFAVMSYPLYMVLVTLIVTSLMLKRFQVLA